MTGEDGWNRVSLNRRWNLVTAEADIFEYDWVKPGVLELAVVRDRLLHEKKHSRSSQGLAAPYSQL